MRTFRLQRWLTSLSIRTQLALLVALVVVPLAGLLVWTGLQARQEAVERARVQTQRLADSLVAEQQAVVAVVQQLFYVLAQLPELRAQDPSVQPLLAELLRLNPELVNIFVADRAGTVWAWAAGAGGLTIGDRRYFANAMASGRLSSGEFVVSRSQHRPVFHLGYPFRDERGDAAGVIAVSFSLDAYRAILKRAQLPDGASYALLDHRGVVLARGIDQDRYVGKPYDRERFDAMAAGPDVQSALEPGLDERMRVASFRKLRLPGEQAPYMYVRAGIPLDVVEREVNAELTRNLAITLALLAAGVAAAMLVGNRAFVARISALETASRRLAGGELEVRVSELVEGGELGSLGRSFDQMAAQLEARQRALQDSELRYREIFDATLDGIMIHDAATGRILDANRVAEQLYGRSKGELLAASADDLSAGEPPWSGAEEAAWIRRTLAEGPQTFEWRARRRGGELFWVEVRLAATTLGGEGRVLATVRDIAARKAAEEAHQELQERLLQAQKLESVGRLAGGVAHDINNMLAVILGEVELLQTDLPPGHPAHQAASEIRRAGQRSRDIARQLLAFSRKQVIRPRPVDPDAVVAETRQTLSRLVGEEYQLDFTPGARGWSVRVDPVQLDQVLLNLVVNSRDAMPAGGRIRITTRQVVLDAAACHGRPGRRPGEFVCLSVADDGVGMDAETMAHVFEPFFTRKEVGAGTGLGLATVYGIASQNGGFVDVASEPGCGATFDVHLPRSLPATARSAPAEDGPATGEAPEGVVPLAAPPAPAAAHGASGAAGTILLVEDEELVRRTAVRMLESLGYHVLAAAAPADALALAREPSRRIDLLLTDVVMPGMKGPELARQLATLRPGLRVLFMSGYTANAALTRGGADGADGFLQKPFTRADLSARVAEALGTPVI
jgi:PAS domain S-box-containing protein